MKIHHIGYAVKNMEKAKGIFETLGYHFDRTVKDVDRKLYILFGEKDGMLIELLCPMENGSPIDDLLKKNGATPYHICYETEDIEKEIERLKTIHFKLVVPPKEACAIQGRKVAFLMNLSVGIIELVEKEISETI